MTKSIPALSENTFLRYFNFIALYIAQGIPEGMILFGVPAWLAMNGKTPGEIGGFVAAYLLPWSFKLIIAPMMDRFNYLPMGRRRPWVIAGQAGLICSFIAMALVPDPLNNIWLLSVSACAVGFFGSFQDVATDGMAIEIVPIDQQARANGFMWGSKIVGTSASLTVGSWLLTYYGFIPAILSLSILIALIMLVPLLLRERAGEKFLPGMNGSSSPENLKIQVNSWSSILKSLFKVLTLRTSLILTVVIFGAGVGFNFMATLLPIFTVQGIGWTAQTYSQYFGTASLIGGIGGMLIGGILIDRFGQLRMMNIYFASVIMLSLGLSFLDRYWKSNVFIAGFMMLYQILYVFSMIGIFAIAMQCCWKKVSATQFTIYMTIGNLGRVVGANLIGPMKAEFSWEYTFLGFTLVMSLTWILIRLLRVKHQLDHIEKLDSQSLPEKYVASLAKA